MEVLKSVNTFWGKKTKKKKSMRKFEKYFIILTSMTSKTETELKNENFESLIS